MSLQPPGRSPQAAPDQHTRGLADVGSDQYAVLIFTCHFNKMKGSKALFILV